MAADSSGLRIKPWLAPSFHETSLHQRIATFRMLIEAGATPLPVSPTLEEGAGIEELPAQWLSVLKAAGKDEDVARAKAMGAALHHFALTVFDAVEASLSAAIGPESHLTARTVEQQELEQEQEEAAYAWGKGHAPLVARCAAAHARAIRDLQPARVDTVRDLHSCRLAEARRLRTAYVSVRQQEVSRGLGEASTGLDNLAAMIACAAVIAVQFSCVRWLSRHSLQEACGASPSVAHRLAGVVAGVVRQVLPPEDSTGVGYRDSYAVHMICLISEAGFWHLLAFVAADEQCRIIIAQPFTAVIAVMIVIRVLTHEVFSHSSPVGRWITFGLVVFMAYAIKQIVLLSQHEDMLPGFLLAQRTGQILSPRATPTTPAASPRDTDPLHMVEVGDGGAASSPSFRWASLVYLLEAPNQALVTYTLIGHRYFENHFSRRGYGGLFLLLMMVFAANTYRETTARRVKDGFHRYASPLVLMSYVVVGWLCLLLGSWLGSRRLRSRLAILHEQAANAAAKEAAKAADDAASLVTENYIRDSLECPITFERFVDPVVAPDGYTYERDAIEEWLRAEDSSPMTGRRMPEGELQPNLIVKGLVNVTHATRGALK